MHQNFYLFFKLFLKASATYGIPSTTLWQRAHRLGIDTPKKEGPTKSWTEENLNSALEALRTGTISANKASKAYGKLFFSLLFGGLNQQQSSIMYYSFHFFFGLLDIVSFFLW